MFVTAYNQYAIDAFDRGAVDYLLKPIRELLDVLDAEVFKQVHRSTIVNLKAVAGVTRDETGRGTLRLRNRPETLPVSLTFMPLFRNM